MNKIHKYKFFLLGLFIFYLILIPLFFYNITSKKVTFTDSSKTYEVEFSNNQVFNTKLEEIGIWKLNSTNSSLIKKVNTLSIILTDKRQIRFSSYDNKKNIVWTSDSIISGNNLIIYINLEPNLLNNSEYLKADQILLHAVLANLYIFNSNNKSQTPEVAFNNAYQDLQQEFLEVKNNPFLLN